MTADTAIRTRLLSLSAVTALVSTRITTGLWHQSPELPAVRVMFVDEIEDQHLRGSVAIFTTRVQVDAKVTEKFGADAKGLAHAIMAAVHGDFVSGVATGLSGFVGTVAPSFRIDQIRPAGMREAFLAEEFREWIVSRDYLVRHRG